MSKVDYLTYFIDLINELNFNIKILCLDREFYTVDVFEFLQDQKIPHITPVVRRGDKMKQLLIGRKARVKTCLTDLLKVKLKSCGLCTTILFLLITTWLKGMLGW
jgi:hypothetical protein